MDKNFCRQIDQQSLVELYVAGKLRGKLLEQFEQHLKDCEDHARALSLEKAFKRGVSEFARGEIKSKLRNRLKKRENTRSMILRYAAILLVAVITPLLLYYQLNVAPDEMADSLSEREESVISDNEIDRHKEEQPEEEKPPKTELKARSSIGGVSEEKPVQPSAPGGSAYKKPDENIDDPEQAKRLEIDKKQRMKSQDMQDMLKAVKASSPPKIEADYPKEEEIDVMDDQATAMATQGYTQEGPSIALSHEMNKKVQNDSIAIRGCIDNFLGHPEGQNYEIEISIQVLIDGKIGEIKMVRTTHQSSDLESCIYNIIKKWTFSDDPGEGTVVQQITY